tara:strand:- start:8065 stop:8709 length:645 start_codon:yes stop_codon:yes gene_type:complete
MTYTNTTLKQAIQDFTENNETTFVNNLNNFIINTEERILKLVDLDYFRKNVTASMTSGNKFLALPDDYLATFSLSIVNSGSNEFLLQKDVNFLQEYSPDPTVTGVPKYYGLFDVDNLILAPTPNQAYSAELHYYYRPQSITASSSGTSWFGDNAPDTLLYGSLVEAYTFMKGEPTVIQLYEKRFVEAVTRLKIYAEGVENTDAYRAGLTRVQKQ